MYMLPPTLSGPVSITSQGMGEKMVPSVFPGTPILQLYENIFRSNMGTKKKCVWLIMVSLIRPARPVTTLCFAGQKVLSL